MIINEKKEYFVIVPILFVLYLFLILVDLIFISMKPWPYSSGGGSNYINLSQSLFWRQYAHHCLYFVLQPLYSLVLIILSLLAGFSSGQYLKETMRESTKIEINHYKQFIIIISLFLISVILSLAIYNIWSEKITNAMIHGSLMWLLILGLLTYEISLVLTVKKPRWLLIIQIPLIIVFVFVILILFLSVGCI